VRAVQITEFGGPEVLRVSEVEEPVAGEHEVLIDVDSAGINYADTHQAENSYLARQHLPLIPGGEVVGRVRGGDLAGRRVVALLSDYGGYAEVAKTHRATVLPIPDDLTDLQALALIVQGTTAWYLLRTSTRMQPGESVVVHSAAGGVGTIAVQLARAWGAGRIIGTATGPAKRELAERLGADAVVDLTGRDDADAVAEALRAANDGKRVDVVLEMIGGHVFDGSLQALKPLGRLAVFGMASRVPATLIDVAGLMGRSQSVSGFWLVHALQQPGGLALAMEELTSMVRAGRLEPITGGTYALDDAAAAHQALRSRSTVGKLVIDVSGASVK
jgi:NADPH:quinone reductase